MYKVLAKHKVVTDCIISEMSNENDDRYFKAKILGWNNFKFISDTLKPQQLFERTIEKVRELRNLIRDNVDILDTLPTKYEFK